MRKALVAGLAGTALAAASVAAVLASSGGAGRPGTLADAASRTREASSMQFELTARIAARTSAPPLTLSVRGATSRERTRVRLQSGGAIADERTDGTFLYVRSPLTRSIVGDRWIRERLGALRAGSEELQTLRRVTPGPTILRVLSRARTASVAGAGTVIHGSAAYADPVVRAALGGLEGGTEFRSLHLTAWLDENGRVRRVRLTGKTADGAASLRLVVSLHGFDRPVTVPAPAPGSFVDADLAAARL